jgi:uncharacterized protein YdeI (YjbR/CyaY-like superfamily)
MSDERADGLPIEQLRDPQAWAEWLEANHGDAPGVWLKIAKKGTPYETVTHAQALKLALCFGWIDGQRDGFDEIFFLQRFTPRKAKSKWSQINRSAALELIRTGEMRPAGQAEVDRAKQDGRWEAAYAPQSQATVPDDFAAALAANPPAEQFFETLRGQNRYAFLYRLQDAKKPETRARRITQFVAMLAEGKTFH